MIFEEEWDLSLHDNDVNYAVYLSAGTLDKRIFLHNYTLIGIPNKHNNWITPNICHYWKQDVKMEIKWLWSLLHNFFCFSNSIAWYFMCMGANYTDIERGKCTHYTGPNKGRTFLLVNVLNLGTIITDVIKYLLHHSLKMFKYIGKNENSSLSDIIIIFFFLLTDAVSCKHSLMFSSERSYNEIQN